MVKPQDEDAAPKMRQYVPVWAHAQLLILLAGYLLEGVGRTQRECQIAKAGA